LRKKNNFEFFQLHSEKFQEKTISLKNENLALSSGKIEMKVISSFFKDFRF